MNNRKIFLELIVKYRIAKEIVLLKELLIKNHKLNNISIAIIFKRKKIFYKILVQNDCKNPTIWRKVNKLTILIIKIK